MDKLSVIIAGDFCSSRNKDKITPAFSKSLLSEVKPYLACADYRLINLECPLTDKENIKPIIKSGPNLCGIAQNVSFLKEGNFDCAVLANNHLGDYGEDVVLDTLDILKKNNISYIGGGRNIEEAYQAYYAVKNNIKISFLAVCENEFGIADQQTAGAAVFSPRRLYNRIQEEKQKANFVIVVFHGGNERNPVPSPETVDRYRMLVDMGADGVIAGHTHCIQGYEMYKSKPIIYSMGNFYFVSGASQPDNSPWRYGYLTKLEFSSQNIELELIPYKMTEDYSLIHVFKGGDKSKMLDYIEKLSEIIQNPDELNRLYAGWLVISGIPYSKSIQYSDEFENDNINAHVLQRIAASKNLFSCEAHTELIRSLLTIELNGKLKDAHEAVNDIFKLQKMPV